MPALQADDAISPYLLLPARPLPVYAAELRQRLAHARADSERASLAATLATAEHEIAVRRLAA